MSEYVPALLTAQAAVKETVEYLGHNAPIAAESITETIRAALRLDLNKRVIEDLRDSCAAECLTMLVQHPETGARHAIPAGYFRYVWLAETEFKNASFGSYEVPPELASEAVLLQVQPFRGWVHGFVQSEFRAWLGNPDTGPCAQLRIRPGETAYRIAERRARASEMLAPQAEHKRGRTRYVGELKRFLASKTPQFLSRMDDDGLERQFRQWYQGDVPLPERRYVMKQIEKHRPTPFSGVPPV